MKTIELPDLWVMFTPEGKADGWMISSREGIVVNATAEAAWQMMTPSKRERDRDIKKGWRVIGVDLSEFPAYWHHTKLLEPASKEPTAEGGLF